MQTKNFECHSMHDWSGGMSRNEKVPYLMSIKEKGSQVKDLLYFSSQVSVRFPWNTFSRLRLAVAFTIYL